MISQENLQYTKLGLLKAVVLIVSSHVIIETLGQKKFFNENWLVTSGGALLGFLIHGLVTRNLNKLINTSEPNKTALSDTIKFGTMLLVKNIFLDLVKKGNASSLFNIDSAKGWATNMMLTLVGLMLYNLFLKDKMPQFLIKRPALLDTAKVAITTLFTDFIPDFDIEPNTFGVIAGRLIGVMFFHTILPKGGLELNL
jgi:hypothetical protein